MTAQLKTIDHYLDSQPEATRILLESLRNRIKNWVPEATEAMSYGIPTFKLNRNLVHFAGYPGHIGFYPGPSGIAAFKSELTGYIHAKGSVQFPLNQPLPWDLIERMVRFRVEEEKSR